MTNHNLRQRYSLPALAPAIARYESLIAAQQFDEACAFFREQLDQPTLCGLEPSLQRARLLELLFPNGLEALPALSQPEAQAFVLYALALTLNLTGGYPGRAIPLYQRHDEICERLGNDKALSASLGHHAKALRQAGRFRESEAVARRGLQIIRARQDHLREAVNLYWLGMGLAHRGEVRSSEAALQRSLRIFKARFAAQSEGVVNAFLAQRALWLNQPEDALVCASRAWEIGTRLAANDDHADLHGAVKVLTAAARMHGEALVLLDKIEPGRERLLSALQRAREIEFVEEELPALRALALLSLKLQRYDKARDYLAQTWSLAARGPFTLYHADSYNLLAQLERALDRRDAAMTAATEAYRLSWCDGPPFAYLRGLEDAAAQLSFLRTVPPQLAAFADSRFAPLPEIDINPPDEFSGN